jgi:hypothetical protein
MERSVAVAPIFSDPLIALVFAIFNIATIALIAVGLRRVNFTEVVAEKGPSVGRERVARTESHGVSVTTEPVPEPASYSRVAGLIGSIVMATFFWGVANAVLVKMIQSPGEVAKMLEGISTFLFAGAAMFLPYAANQIRELFAPRG